MVFRCREHFNLEQTFSRADWVWAEREVSSGGKEGKGALATSDEFAENQKDEDDRCRDLDREMSE
jgi:hypothetical protein